MKKVQDIKIMLYKIRQLFIRMLMKMIVSIGCFFIKQEYDCALFGTSFKRFTDNPKYLFLYMLENNYSNIFYVLDNKKEYKELRNSYPVLYKWSFECFIRVMKAKYFFYTHSIFDIYPAKSNRTVAINLWHGTALKPIGFDSDVELRWINQYKKLGLKLPYEIMDYVVTAHKNCNWTFQSSMGIDESKIIASGLPRNDFLFKHKCNNELIGKLKKEIYQSDDKKTILYAPTFRDYSSEKIKDNIIQIMQLFKKIAKNNHYKIGVRLHPLDKLLLNEDIFEDNIVDLTSYADMQEILLATDIVISDYSSLVFDYSILERPVLLHLYDLADYTRARGGLYFDIKDIYQGYGLSENIEELEQNINESEKYRNLGFYKKFNTENACENILTKISL